MKRLFIAFALFVSGLAGAQTVTVTASHLGGSAPITGTITFQPVTPDGKTQVSTRLGTGGITSRQPITAGVSAGVFSVDIPDAGVTNPANICFTVTVRSQNGLQQLGPGFSCVQPSANNDWCVSGVCNFDNYVPNLAPVALQNTGPLGPAGQPLEFVGTWSASTTYTSGETVAYSNAVYISLTNPNHNNVPSSSPANWSVVVSPASLIASPSDSQSVSQPVGTSFDANILNRVYNAAKFPGADIGVKTNAAIAALVSAYGGGTVLIPSGSYTLATRITVPQGIILTGQADKTVLHWTGSGAAIVLANIPAPTIYVQGSLRDLTILGTSTAGQYGVYQGGDPTNVNAPSTYIGYNYTMVNVHINLMDSGIYWGNGVFNIEWHNVISSYNLNYGWLYPATSTFGGQNNHFYHSEFADNPAGAFQVRQNPFVTFDMFGMDIEYNGGSTTTSGPSMMHGGNYVCYGCHIENFNGPFIEVGGNNDGAVFYGGIWVIQGGSLTEASLVNLNPGRSTFAMSGTTMNIGHTVTNLVTQTASGTNLPQIDVRNISLVDAGFFLKNITSLKGPSISWCMPYDNASGTGKGFCYDGKTYKNPLSTIASSVDPTTLPDSAAVMSWNGDGASGGVDFYNTFASASNANYAFRWNVLNSGVYSSLGNISRAGILNVVGYAASGAAGVSCSGAPTAAFAVVNGIVTHC